MTFTPGQTLIEVDDLASAMSTNDRLVILDVRWRLGKPSAYPDYLAGHLPSARWVDLDSDLAGAHAPDGRGGRHPLPSSDHFTAVMRGVGVDTDSVIVIYDDANSLAAARLWWMLLDAGLTSVAVLNGGFAAWQSAGGTVESGQPAPPQPGNFAATPGHLPTIDGDQVAAGVAAGALPPLLDVRAPERYRGEVEPMDPVAGHIPGARNLSSMTHVDSAGRFRSAAEIAASFASVGVGEPELIAYCGSGITAAHTALARVVAGLAVPTIYPGSWSDWVSSPDRPVATGEES